MVNIAFIVGKMTDTYPTKYTSKKAPKWLKKGAVEFEDFVEDEDHEVPSDVAMAMYLSNKHPKDDITCFNGYEVTKSDLDDFDVVFVIYDPIEVFHCGGKERTCPKNSQKMERALKNTSAFVYPYPDFHKYIIVKPSYYADLKRAGIPVGPFFKVTPQHVLKNVSAFRKRVENKGWEGVIVKPSYSGYSLGIKVFKNFDRTNDTTIKKVFTTLKKYGFPNATIQEFIPSFGSHFEIRTYWINEKYAYSVGTLTEAVGKDSRGLPISDEDTFVSEGGKIPDKIKRKLLPLGRNVLKAIRQYPYTHPMVRIDFGCCVNPVGDCNETYFVNEVETMAANMLAPDTDYPVVEKVANAAYNFAKKVKGKPKPKGKKSTFKVKKGVCIKPDRS
jgi:hypothetical protein